MRRIVLILLIGAVVAAAIAGGWLYVRRNSGARLLARAQLALRAQKYDQAIDLARNYTKENPEDWQGWRHVGSLLRQGLLVAGARRPGLLVERIFPTGLADLSTGLLTQTGSNDTMRFESVTFTGGICWTEHDRHAVIEVATAHGAPY